MKLEKVTEKDVMNSNNRLFNIITKLGIAPDTPQIIRWYIITEDSNEAKMLYEKLEAVSAEMKYYSKYSIKIHELEKGGFYVIVKISDFHFSIPNLHEFSKKILDIANKNGVQYDFWEMQIKPEDLKLEEGESQSIPLTPSLGKQFFNRVSQNFKI